MDVGKRALTPEGMHKNKPTGPARLEKGPVKTKNNRRLVCPRGAESREQAAKIETKKAGL
jgi:hypothetical protein